MKMKMILLLLGLTSCVCAGTFVVNVTQTSYQEEEGRNVTLEWTFTTHRLTSLKAISVFCEMFTDQKISTLFHLHEGVEVPESQDEQFAGRVQFDEDVLREGRVRLHVSRLRTEDSGQYMCDVFNGNAADHKTCRLNVTAAAEGPEPGPGPERPQEEGGTNEGLYVGLPAAAALVLMIGIVFILLRRDRHEKNLHESEKKTSPTESESIRTNRDQSPQSLSQAETLLLQLQKSENLKEICESDATVNKDTMRKQSSCVNLTEEEGVCLYHVKYHDKMIDEHSGIRIMQNPIQIS